jgi:hypothetical protein
MTEQELNIAISAMAEQRNAALDEIIMLKVKIVLLQKQIVELTKPKEE